MLKPSYYTHNKSNKITFLATTTTTDSYKQLFVLITMLLTVLSVQQSTFAMAAPLDQQQQQQQPIMQQQELLLQQHHTLEASNNKNNNNNFNPSHHTQLHDILLAETNGYDHHYRRHPHHHQQQQHHQLQQLETDLTTTTTATATTSEERLQKRHITWHDYYENIMQSQHINWYNPCGGVSNMDASLPVKRKRPPPIKKELRSLQNAIAKNYKTLKETLHAINIKKMNQWKYLENKYSFLPKINTNSSISLRRWHHQMQIYVAAFEYLRRAQLHFDNVKASHESAFSRELDELMKDARSLLCSIEQAINNTTTRKGKSEIDSLFINRTKMEKILKFTTDIKYVSPLHWYQVKDDGTPYLVQELDLKFAKSHYYSFIRKLLKTLRQQTKRKGPIYLGKKGRQQKEDQKQQQQHIKKTDTPAKTRHSKRKLE